MNSFTELTAEQLLQQFKRLRDPNIVVFAGIPKYNMMTEQALNILANFPINLRSDLLLQAALKQEVIVEMRIDNPHLSLKAVDAIYSNIKRRLYQVCVDDIPVLELVRYKVLR